jgi:anti-sigma regulatory factor (Ser/Thr protein kinase)
MTIRDAAALARLSRAQDPPTGRDRTQLLAALPTAPGLARAFVTQTLQDWSVTDISYEDVELLTSELVTNAVRHTGRADGPPVPQPTETVVVVGIRVCLHGSVVRLEVWDNDSRPPVPVQPRPDDESGRGLLLVEALSQAWGTRPSRVGGKVVWCEVARDDSIAASTACGGSARYLVE